MTSKYLFSIEPCGEKGRYIVTYPDGTCDIMSLSEVRKNFDIPVDEGQGDYPDYASALAEIMEEEDDVPGDFFTKNKPLEHQHEGTRKRQFASGDSSLI